ncbi:unnamed protein product [Microthlaspi erraticum]|uniref:Uncharacterized protein n=1 Tax=Microthlaspi erraticum TaxID=1685480 RepID=A0A6D2JH88_9BRAS|nr:unnamed protein product [Microthlaspi erraticum]
MATARVLVGDTEMELGEVDRPPGDPPDGQVSWASKVRGSSGRGIPNPKDVVADEFVQARLHVEFPNGEDGEPVIGQEVLEAMNGLWKRCMIVKVLGRNVAISVLSRKLREM